jgi:GT2 family glycosyltransferase
MILLSLHLDKNNPFMITQISPKVTIIIPNYNGVQHLTYCLPFVISQTYPNFEIVLVDNGSTDNSISFIKQHFPQIQLIANKSNLGFAEANNLAIQATTAPYIVTLNNDTLVKDNWLSEMMNVAQSQAKVGMVACKILNLRYHHLMDSAGMDIDQAGMAWNRYNNLPNNPTETEPYEVFCPNGAAALYKRAMLEETGLFDEAFFAYCEDMDLGWRGRLMGWQCLYVPTAIVYHYHSATSKQGSKFKRYLISRNRIWTVIKNYPDIWFNLPQLVFYDTLALVYRIIKEKKLTPLYGRVAIIPQLKKMLQQRQIIQCKRTVTTQQLKALMLPSVNLFKAFKL